MPYDTSDPRSQLSTAVAAPEGIARPATYRELPHADPDEVHPGASRTWWTRSQAMVIAHTAARPPDELVTSTHGEHVVLVLDGATLDVITPGSTTSVANDAVVVVPPGESTLRIMTRGTVVRVFAAALEPELAARSSNHDDYLPGDVNVARFEAWPDAPSGPDVRVYPLAAYPPEPGRLGRIFRCSTVMVNVFEQDWQPRDPATLSPHHHDDFEQVSLQIDGDYVHHMRLTWSPDSTVWRDDEHRHTIAPAVVVIPPPLIHTSQSVGEMRHWLIDVFSPPRLDFSQRPGWVLNAADYPMRHA